MSWQLLPIERLPPYSTAISHILELPRNQEFWHRPWRERGPSFRFFSSNPQHCSLARPLAKLNHHQMLNLATACKPLKNKVLLQHPRSPIPYRPPHILPVVPSTPSTHIISRFCFRSVVRRVGQLRVLLSSSCCCRHTGLVGYPTHLMVLFVRQTRWRGAWLYKRPKNVNSPASRSAVEPRETAAETLSLIGS